MMTAVPLLRARHRPLISWQLTCPLCGQDSTQQRCEHPVSYVANISPDAVITQAEELLACSSSHL